MNVLSINCRGLGNPDTVSALRALVRREAPAILFLCETKLSGRELRGVRERMKGYFGIEVDSMGRSGGLAMLWRKELDCAFVSSSVHHIDINIKGDEGEWRLTGFYGWPVALDRHLSWELLRLLSRQSLLPWVCIGDYNEILFSTEMKGGSRPQWQMNNFRAAVDECGLKDISREGYQFSWDNGQSREANRQCMLDRAMSSSSWTDMLPYARLIYLEREWLDHAPIKLVLDHRRRETYRQRGFKFEQMWVGEEGCAEAVESIGLKQQQLGRWNGSERTEANVLKRCKLIAELAGLRRQEEQYWRQRSRALWLKDDDKNTKFFHSRAGERKGKIFIAKLVDDEGVTRCGDAAVANVANSYFQELFSSSNPVIPSETIQGVANRVTDDMNATLRRAYNEEEVIDALHQMHPLKAPGLDGMNGLFYQTYWGSIGSEVVSTVLAILRGKTSAR
ncbi:uncharacterized protein LOC141608158 [Silene latifolia]|uniref:uncharacterized protein LOC141608158 n=1 Tax=Silene latifolia TaxID=37657 RepID=UPI003D780250